MSDEWVMVPREPTANQLVDGAYEVPDPISHRGELTARMVYRAMLDAAPQQAEPVAWGQLGLMNGKAYLRMKYDREPYPPPSDVVRNLCLVPLWTHPPAAEVQRLRDAATRLVALWNPARPESASVVADAIDKLCRELEGQ